MTILRIISALCLIVLLQGCGGAPEPTRSLTEAPCIPPDCVPEAVWDVLEEAGAIGAYTYAWSQLCTELEPCPDPWTNLNFRRAEEKYPDQELCYSDKPLPWGEWAPCGFGLDDAPAIPSSLTFSVVEQGDEITLSSTAECGDMADYTLNFINNYDAPGCRMTITATSPISCRQEDEHTVSCGRGE